MSPTLDELIQKACARVARLTPREAFDATAQGALLVDIRSDSGRALGVVPGSLHIPRTVLEWRVAPGSAWRSPHVGENDRLILLCDHGYSSILAAATLTDLGLDVADVIGGFEAWVEASLPTRAPARRLAGGALPGMGPREPL